MSCLAIGTCGVGSWLYGFILRGMGQDVCPSSQPFCPSGHQWEFLLSVVCLYKSPITCILAKDGGKIITPSRSSFWKDRRIWGHSEELQLFISYEIRGCLTGWGVVRTKQSGNSAHYWASRQHKTPSLNPASTQLRAHGEPLPLPYRGSVNICKMKPAQRGKWF